MSTLLNWLLQWGEGNTPLISPFWAGVGWFALAIVLLVIFRVFFIFVVPPRSTGFILFGGKIFRESLNPGWYLQFPFVYYGQAVYLGMKTLKFEEETRTQDQAFVVVKGALQYKVVAASAATYFYGVDGKPEQVMRERVLCAMRSAVSSRVAKEAFEHKDAIATDVTNSISAGMLQDIGVEVIQVPITEVAPHKEVAAAFNAVQAAQRRVDEAQALAEVERKKAQGDADAKKIRAGGQAAELEAQSAGLLQMYAKLCGEATVSLPPEGALFLMTHFLGLQMRTAFAESGRATAMVIPDDREIIRELVELLPTLVAHTAVDEVDDTDEPERLMEVMLQKVEQSDEVKGSVQDFIENAKANAGEISDEAIESLPRLLRPFAKRLREKLRKRAQYGGGST